MLGNDDGVVTVETAIATGALIAVFTTLVAGLVAVGAHLAAIDIAGAAARAYTIGVPYEPPRGAVTVTESGGLATATAVVPSPLGPKPPALSSPSNKNSERHERAHHPA